VWSFAPTWVMDQCVRRLGDTFTLTFSPSGRKLVMVSDPDAVKAVFTAPPDVAPSAAGASPIASIMGPSSVITLTGPEHMRQRKLLLPPFHGERMREYAEVIVQATQRSMADWPLGEPMKLSERTRAITLEVILRAVFGVEASRMDALRGAIGGLITPTQFPALLLFALRRRFGMTQLLALVALVNIVSAYVLERHDLQFFTSYWFSWTLGAWIADARAQKASAMNTRRASNGLYAVAAVLVALGCVAFHFGQYGAFQLWALGFAFYLYKALDRGAGETPVARVLSRFGDFSFSLYLIHLPIFVLLSSLLYRSTLQLSIWPSFGFMLVAVPVAYVFYRLVELPAMKWSASLKTRNKARVAAARA